MWEGFEDELQKIAFNMAAPMRGLPSQNSSLSQVKKMVHNQKSALSTRKPSYSQVHITQPMSTPAPDPLSGVKMSPPPPVTAG